MNAHFETLQTICENRQCRRRFADRPLADDLIEKIRAVGLTSPYASGKKNWEIMVITDPAVRAAMVRTVKQRVDELRAGIRPDLADDFSTYARNFTSFADAPALFIPTYRVAPSLSLMCDAADERVARWERDNYVKSISCVAMLILLAAESLGLAACYMTGALIAEEELGRLIKVKTGRNIGAIIPVGYRIEQE
ncbi:MAG TPA: nitroreductase family protein [Accumulibacter sp.]|jgi:nitroreductase|nr:nitroreductase family protein [Accumulibacter sp.]HQC80395.1 nitroreductase family protein [Accumulibacter sp.]